MPSFTDLSDYVPLLIEKIAGLEALFILITMAAFLDISVKSFYIFLTGEKVDRLLPYLFFICRAVVYSNNIKHF